MQSLDGEAAEGALDGGAYLLWVPAAGRHTLLDWWLRHYFPLKDLIQSDYARIIKSPSRIQPNALCSSNKQGQASSCQTDLRRPRSAGRQAGKERWRRGDAGRREDRNVVRAWVAIAAGHKERNTHKVVAMEASLGPSHARGQAATHVAWGAFVDTDTRPSGTPSRTQAANPGVPTGGQAECRSGVRSGKVAPDRIEIRRNGQRPNGTNPSSGWVLAETGVN
jgi:hypothetical protein